MTGAGAPARSVRPAPAPAGAAQRAGARLPSFLRFFPAAARRCLSPPASSSRRGGLPAALRAGAGIALLLLAALAALPSPAQAQNVLVSNTEQSTTSEARRYFAQPFTTGGNTGGYILSNVGIGVGTALGSGTISDFRARILADSSGSPGSTVIATLTNPSSFTANAVNVFSAPGNPTLAANTTYYVEFVKTSGGELFSAIAAFDRTTSDSEDDGASSGWDIGDGTFWKSTRDASWNSSSGSVAQIRISGFAVNSAGDYTPPAVSTGTRASIRADGVTIAQVFNENLDGSNLPPTDAFTVTSDSQPHTVTGVRRSASNILLLTVSPRIRSGQTVTVAYEDPTAGDDANAIQDAVGNDVADFTGTAFNFSGQARVRPGPPTGLTATVAGDTTVDLSWIRPTDNGGRTISGYRIEWRAADGTTWQDAVADTGSADTTHSVTVPSGETNRRFRVSAKNSVGIGNPSNVATTFNTPATGAPAVTGPGRAGQMLTAATGGISDVDGLTGASYAYRWFHLEGTTETAISGATGTSYMPVAADVGKRIGVRVDFTDDRGYAESLASAPVAIRAAMPPAACPAFSVPSGREQVWTGTVTVAELVIGQVQGYGYSAQILSGGELSDTDFEIGPNSYTVDQSWVDALGSDSGQLVFGLDRALTAREVANLRLHVCGETYAFGDAAFFATSTDYSWPTAGLDWSGLVGSTRVLHLTGQPNRPATGLPAVTGTARVGSTVTASTALIRDADGLMGPAYEYQWLREDADGGNRVEISGATASTYTLTADDAGKRVRVRVSFTDDALNEEELTSAAFPRTGTIAMPVPPMTDPSELLSATLTVKDVASLFLGCSGGTSASFVSCKNTDVLTARGFTVPGTTTTRNIDQIQLSTGGGLVVVFDGSFTDAQKARLAMDFDGTQLTFSDATVGNNNDASWTSTGLSWSADDTVAVKVKDRGTGDITPPELTLAIVGTQGVSCSLQFGEDLDPENLPQASAITLTVDGNRATVARVEGSQAIGRRNGLILRGISPVIQQGQVVTVSYTDPTSGDDEHAIQDASGNDVATFESVAVINRSEVTGIPGAPTGLTATKNAANPGTQIDLAWDAPTEMGTTNITGYRIEWSADGNDPWTEREADTGTTVRSYSDSGLPSPTTRYYRVSARNDAGAGTPSGTADATTDDVAGPVLVSAAVAEHGLAVELIFDEAPAGGVANLPGASDFEVTVDGAPLAFVQVSANAAMRTITLSSLAHSIKQGQTVVITYTDPTSGNDARAIQDALGNDAASFTTGVGDVPAVVNDSTAPPTAPGVPRNLEAESGGDDRIVVTWDAPANTGGRAITGYRVEVSEDGNEPWAELAGNHDTMNNGKFEYIHTGLDTGDVRHYRVSARNGPLDTDVGELSEVAMGVVEMKGRVVLSAAAASVAEGGSVAWTVTATTDEDAQPESGLQMEVTVVSEDGTAAAPGDYAALEAAAGTVTFRRSDFGRRNVQDVGYRWVAVKRGPVAVAIADDVEVEAEESFALTMSIGSGGTGWVRGTDRVEVAIPDTDEWGIAVAAEPAEIAEGETREVALTARIVLGDGTVPGEDACVARFPVSVRLETGGTATAGTDYTLDGALDEQTIAACGAAVSWTVSLTAAVDRVDDPGETLTFAPQFVEVPETAPASPPPAPAAVTVREGRGVVLSAFTLDVEEGGEESYTAVLTSRPTGTVRLTPRVSGDPDVTDVTVEQPRLTFTRDNWNQPQTLTVLADQDPDDEDDAATISHGVTGADYGANGVTAPDVAVAVHDDDKTFGVMTVRLSDGADGAGTHDPAPAEHHGEAFHITLWWSETRTHDYEGPRKAIGADRAIRVTGAAVVPVRDEHTGSWTQSRLRLKLTPDGTDDVTLVLEPMDCSYPDWRQPRPDPYALCAWRRDGLGITGLAERVRWTVHGIGAAPAAPGNLTLGTDEILTVQADVVDSRRVLVAGFDADRDASHWRVEAQAPGGDWSGARVWRGAKHGSRHNVRLDGLAPDGAWAVRARWENRYGAGPWAEVRTTDGVAPAAPRGLAAAPGPDGRSVRLTWRPASAASAARYQYRLGRLAQTLAGGWLDIPDSGPGAAHRTSFTVHGVERVWEIKAQLRAVSASGQAGAASAEARVPAARPRVLQDGVALTSDPGEDGRYGIGDRIEVAVTMSRPVRHEGTTPPTVQLAFDGQPPREAALVRIRQPGTAGIGDSGVGSGDTLVFAYTVAKGDEDMDGIAIPANGLRLNGGRLLDAGPGGGDRPAAVGLGRARHFPGHRVQGVLPVVTGIERLDNKVWVHYERDLQPWTLDPVLRTGALGGQFHPGYETSRPVSHAVIDARIVRGRGWSRNCGRTETGCRTVRLTLGRVQRGASGSPPGGHEAPESDETVEISYAPNPHHAKYRLRDAAGNEAPGFAPMVAVHLAPGSAPVLAVDDGAGREGVAPVRFTVRLVPAATSEVRVGYMTADMPATVRAPAGRATAGEDYEPKSGTLVFAPGETVKTIEVTVLEDTLPDSGEVFRLMLANPSGAALGDAVATGTIRNDELLTAAFGSLPPSHDGETAFTLGLAFSEEVAVSAQTLRDAALSVTGGSVTGVRQVDAASTRRWEIAVAPSSDAAVTVALAPRASCDAAGAVCTEDGLGLDRAAEAAVPGPAALEAPTVAGVAQAGSTLEASVAGGAVTWQWLRGGVEIAGADASAYTPVAADVGARLSVRAGRGGAAATSAATAPVWPAPVNPPLGAGEEELLSAVLTLEAWHGFPLRVAGYGRVLDSRFGDGRDRVRGRRNAPCGVGVRGQRVRNVRAGDGFGGAPGGGAGGVLERTPDCRARGGDGGRRGGALGSDAAAARGVSALHGRLVGRGPGGGVAAPDAGGGPGDRRGGDLGPRRQRDLGRGRACRGGSAVQRAGDGDGAAGGGADARHRARRHAPRGGVYRRHGHGHALVPLHGGRRGRGREAGPDRGGRALAQRRGDRGRRRTRGRARLLRRPLGDGGGG